MPFSASIGGRVVLQRLYDSPLYSRRQDLATVRAADTGKRFPVGQGPVRSPLSATRPDLLHRSGSTGPGGIEGERRPEIKKTLLLADARGECHDAKTKGKTARILPQAAGGHDAR